MKNIKKNRELTNLVKPFLVAHIKVMSIRKKTKRKEKKSILYFNKKNILVVI